MSKYQFGADLDGHMVVINELNFHLGRPILNRTWQMISFNSWKLWGCELVHLADRVCIHMDVCSDSIAL